MASRPRSSDEPRNGYCANNGEGLTTDFLSPGGFDFFLRHSRSLGSFPLAVRKRERDVWRAISVPSTEDR